MKLTPTSKCTKLEAIVSGMERAKQLHWTKQYDIAICINIALGNADFKIIRKPKQ